MTSARSSFSATLERVSPLITFTVAGPTRSSSPPPIRETAAKMEPRTATTKNSPITSGPALERGLRVRLGADDLSATRRSSSSSRSRGFVLSWRFRSAPRVEVLLQHPGRREVIHASGTLRAARPHASDGHAGREPLVPLARRTPPGTPFSRLRAWPGPFWPGNPPRRPSSSGRPRRSSRLPPRRPAVSGSG